MSSFTREQMVDAIRNAIASAGGQRLTRDAFLAKSSLKPSDIFRYFPKWSDALAAAGATFEPYHQKLDPAALLIDWGEVVRRHGHIPTRNAYQLEGKYSPGVFERQFGPWSSIPDAFRKYATGLTEWADVIAHLPAESSSVRGSDEPIHPPGNDANVHGRRHSPLPNRPTYGNPIDFRGLRHEPVNENGVVFMFGMVARELGYLVESMQSGFPDCEAKRRSLLIVGRPSESSSSLKVGTSGTMVTPWKVVT